MNLGMDHVLGSDGKSEAFLYRVRLREDWSKAAMLATWHP
jgi:hypothetical protein